VDPEWTIAQQVDDVFKPDAALILRVMIVVQDYKRGVTTKDEFLEVLLNIINEEF